MVAINLSFDMSSRAFRSNSRDENTKFEPFFFSRYYYHKCHEFYRRNKAWCD